MYQVLIAGTIEYNTRLLQSMPVWENTSGFTVAEIVYNGAEALKILRNQKYDMVITEIDVPGLDGMQLLRHINQEVLCPIVVILSNTVEFQYVRECILFGAFDYLKKMPDKETLLTVLKRAREQLAAGENSITEYADAQYPVLDEERIVRSFFKHDNHAISIFEETIDRIYEAKKEQSVQNDIVVKKLYLKIISRIFNEYRWLYNYVDIDYYKKIDYLWAGSQAGFKDFFMRKIKHLYDLVNYLFLPVLDKGLNDLMQYILHNPEADLRLKTVAENVFLNYSYLSSNFSAKTGMHYNEYILNIKMARAAYLLLNTDMKIYEICSAVSYQDTNYFTRQFKKIYSVSPSEYKTVSGGDESLDSACL